MKVTQQLNLLSGTCLRDHHPVKIVEVSFFLR